MLQNKLDKIKKKKESPAFTLAEVLITLAIIGVVAALTIPTLLNNITDSQYKSAFKKVYSNLVNATNLMVTNNGGDIWDTTSGNLAMRDEYAKYLSYIKSDTMNNILNQNWYCYKNTSTLCTAGATSSSYYGLVLKDGVVLYFGSGTGCLSTPYTASPSYFRCGTFIVDVNGNKPPNMLGRDAFSVVLVKDSSGNYRTLPAGAATDYSCVAGSNTSSTSLGCSEYVIEDKDLPQ